MPPRSDSENLMASFDCECWKWHILSRAPPLTAEPIGALSRRQQFAADKSAGAGLATATAERSSSEARHKKTITPQGNITLPRWLNVTNPNNVMRDSP